MCTSRQFGIVLGLLAFLASTAWAGSQSTSFTYQGQLQEDGAPFSGSVNLQFRLWDDPVGGGKVAPLVSRVGVPVIDGLFSVELDFGSSFGTEQRWIEVIVNGMPLLPRQPITAAPVAIFALSGLEGPVGPAGPPGPQGVPGPIGTPELVFAGTVRQSHYRSNSPVASYGSPSGTSQAFTSLGRAEALAPTACLAADLHASLTNNSGGYPESTVTLMVNGTASSLSCATMAGSLCEDTDNSVLLAAGDRLALRLEPAMPFAPISTRQSDVRVWLKFGFTCSQTP